MLRQLLSETELKTTASIMAVNFSKQSSRTISFDEALMKRPLLSHIERVDHNIVQTSVM